MSAHDLVDDGPLALHVLTRSGFDAVTVRDVVTTRLAQGVPGSLGAVARRLAETGVDVELQYSDHAGNLVLLVPEAHLARCRRLLGADTTPAGCRRLADAAATRGSAVRRLPWAGT